MKYIDELEKRAKDNFVDIQPGDAPATHANSSSLENYVQFRPKISVELGVKKFVEWFKRGINWGGQIFQKMELKTFSLTCI